MNRLPLIFVMVKFEFPLILVIFCQCFQCLFGHLQKWKFFNLFLKIFVFFSLFSVIKMCELFLQFLQVVCNIVVLHITIRAESLQIVFSWDVSKKYTEGVHSHLVSLELSKYSPSLWPPWKSFCSKIWRSARTRYSKDLWGRFSLWTPASN